MLVDLDKDEKILKVLHRHWFNILEQYFGVFFILIFIIVGFSIATSVGIFSAQDNPLVANLFLLGQNFFTIFLWFYVFFVWIDYYFDVWVVTDKRIINIEQKSLFSRRVSELKLDKIQDVTVEIVGLIPTFLGYGNVLVQTASEITMFVFRKVPNPNEVKSLIMDLQKEAIKEESDELGEIIRKEIHHDEK